MWRAWREVVKEEGKAGRGNEGGRNVGGEHGVREGVKEELIAQREINEGGEAGRGIAWSEGGSERGRECTEGEKEGLRLVGDSME